MTQEEPRYKYIPDQKSIWAEGKTWKGAGIWTVILTVNFGLWAIIIYAFSLFV